MIVVVVCVTEAAPGDAASAFHDPNQDGIVVRLTMTRQLSADTRFTLGRSGWARCPASASLALPPCCSPSFGDDAARTQSSPPRAWACPRTGRATTPAGVFVHRAVWWRGNLTSDRALSNRFEQPGTVDLTNLNEVIAPSRLAIMHIMASIQRRSSSYVRLFSFSLYYF